MMNKKLVDILNKYEGDDTDLCYYVFDILKSEEKPEVGLKFFYESIKTEQPDGSMQLEKIYTLEELKNWDKLYSKYINELLIAVVNKAHLQNWNVDKFYSILWEKIINDIILENDKMKAFMIFKFAQSLLMPYVEINKPMSMDDEHFNDIIKRNQATIIKIRHIRSLNLAQKTEVSSLILQEINNVKTFEEQSVILAVVLDEVTQDRIKELMQMLSNGKVELPIEEKE